MFGFVEEVSDEEESSPAAGAVDLNAENNGKVLSAAEAQEAGELKAKAAVSGEDGRTDSDPYMAALKRAEER